ncbi:MAG: hypothetical protein CMC18_01335, partial [Flavobacteriaceae bacterium]|nr:hypothetical protein [Flavobacteriaceae bacterium]
MLFLWIVPFDGSAQENGYWTFSAGLNAVDFNVSDPYTSSNTTIEFGGEPFLKDLFQAGDMNWNSSAFFFEGKRYTQSNFSLSGRIAFNKITEIVPPSIFTESMNQNFYNADLGIQYHLFQTGPFEPYIGMGAGITRMMGNSQSHLNFSGGLNLWFNDNVGLTVNSLFKSNPNASFNNYFQHNLGLVVKTKKKDQDNDGVPDTEDE